jgi:hypothetical protein
MTAVRGSVRTSGVACASVSLPLRDQVCWRGYARPEPGRPMGLLITSPSIDRLARSRVVVTGSCLSPWTVADGYEQEATATLCATLTLTGLRVPVDLSATQR